MKTAKFAAADAVKFCAVGVGVLAVSAVAALNWPALIVAVLAENQLLGLYNRLEVARK